jgi:hypothetical protein
MPHVSIHYRIYLGAGHHRRPRNPQPWVEPYASSEVDVTSGGVITPFAPPTLPYTPPDGVTVEPAFLFWGVSDGATGRTVTTQALSETVGSSPVSLIAWYFLPAGGGGGPGVGSEVLIDAYSVAQGDFVDDIFVTVTSDPSLTTEANDGGDVPTTVTETVLANGSISTGETLDEWVTSPGGASAVGALLTAPAMSTGLEIATYAHAPTRIPNVNVPREGVLILFGVVNDAAGVVIPLGGGGPVPIGPWGPFMARLAAALGVHAGAAGLSKQGAARIRQAADAEIAQAARELADAAAKGFGQG